MDGKHASDLVLVAEHTKAAHDALGIDADKLDGFHASQSPGANQVPVTDAGGNLSISGKINANNGIMAAPTVVTTNWNLTACKTHVVDISSDVTLTLPSSPNVGDQVTICDPQGKCGTYTVTVARNGQPIMSLAEDMILDVPYAPVTLTYVDSTRGWVLS